MSTLLRPFEFALNAALKTDIETADKLAAFDQRAIEIVISDLNQHICVTINQQRLLLTTKITAPAALTITANALALLKLTQDPESLFSSDITINGDVQFAKQLQDVMAGFDFDWEAQLAKITGDTLAYPIAHSLRSIGSWLQTTHQSFQLNVAEYLREESRLLPDKCLTDDYMNEIDTLRADCDRLEARINRLQGATK